MEVIPSLNCHHKDYACVQEKVRLVEKFSDVLHLDIADGCFTFSKSWNDPQKWVELGTRLKLEVHLMVEDPERQALEWLAVGAKRIIVHVETLDEASAGRIADACRINGAELALALSPETRVERIAPYTSLFSEFQILAVHPGLAGQTFLPLVLEKVRFLRTEFPDSWIEVDGGINLVTGRAAKEAGANALVAATFIFTSEDPERSFSELQAV